MRKRNSKAKKAAKAATDNNQPLDDLFTNVGLIRRDWYTKALHEKTMHDLVHVGKLQAIKNLMDISREKDGDGRYGLKNLKDFVDQFDYNVKQRRIALGLESTLPFNTGNQVLNVVDNSPVPDKLDRVKVINELVDMITLEIRLKNSTKKLRELIDHVPFKYVTEAWLRKYI